MYPHLTPVQPSAASVSPDESSLQSALPRILAEADAAPLSVPPPVGNTGVEVSNAGVDYLEVTHSTDVTGRVWFDILGIPESEWQELPRGLHGYPRMRVCGHVSVWYGGDARMGSHLAVSGQGCRELEARGVVTSWAAFAGRLKEWDCTATRLDLFRDDYSGGFDVAECEGKLRSGEVRSRTKRAATRAEFEIGAEDGGRTVYIGKRTSDTMVRVYDKGQQMCPREGDRAAWLAEHGPHVRVEVEVRRDRADAVLTLLASRGFDGRTIAALINAHVEFKDAYARDHNGGRVPTWAPWAALMQTAERLVLAVTATGNSLLEAERRLDRQWGPIIATLHAYYRGDTSWVARVAARNFPRLRDKHSRMIEDADRARGLCHTGGCGPGAVLEAL